MNTLFRATLAAGNNSVCLSQQRGNRRFGLFCLFYLLTIHPALADSFLARMEQATPARRVVLLLNYFDTCQAVTQHQPYAFRLLDHLRELGQQTHDEQLLRYVGFTRDTFAKHQQTNVQNASLFLAVSQRAAEANDPQIAAVCQHFAGQYYFLNEEYGKAFEQLLAANKAFRRIGYDRVPEISRYLYELAFNYYHFRDYKKVIGC